MTTNDPSVVDAETFSVRRTITIAAPQDKVWAAITEAEHLAQWFPEKAELASVAVGTTGTMTWADYGDIPVRIDAVDAPHSITYRWGNDDALGALGSTIDDAHSTVFTFTLEPLAGGTRLTVVESGFETTSDPTANLESHREGWDYELDELVAYLEGGA